MTRSLARLELIRLLGSRARPDAKWIAEVTGAGQSLVTSVLEEIHDHLATERAIRRSLELGGRTYYSQFPAPLDLYAITRILRPNHIVESGVASGISSAHFLMALQMNGKGKLHSIDRPQYQKAKKRRRGELSWSIPLGKDSGWAIPPKLKKGWDLRKGRSEDLLAPLVEEIRALDFFCHDSPWTPEHLAYELDMIQPSLRSGSVVVADNSRANPETIAKLARAISARVFHRKSSDLIGMRLP